ncbi:hypothetical protein JVU11DRAFT_2526 [Chiua virens]|nr:hypothetical protein JVU11DRAFT_2526 [Chiua virens]
MPVAQLLRVMNFAHEALTEDLSLTKRDLFYKDVTLFKSQKTDRDSQLTDAYSVLPSKGLVCGSGLTIHLLDGQVLQINDSEGTLIPPGEDIERFEVKPDVSWVLVAEKEAVFHTLCRLEFTKYPGLPGEKGTQISPLDNSIPIMGLVDGDAYGLDILSVYRYGSQSLRHENEKLAANRIQWLGVRAADLASLNIHLDTLIPITKHDVKKVSRLGNATKRKQSTCRMEKRAHAHFAHQKKGGNRDFVWGWNPSFRRDVHNTIGWLQEHEKFTLPTLEPVSSYFSIPRLDDRPQDPIVRTIQPLVQSSPVLPLPPVTVDPDVSIQIKPTLSTLWKDASLPRSQDVDLSMCWDPNPPMNNRNPPFLTEQHRKLLGSLRNWTQSNTNAKYAKGNRTAESDLFASLHLFVCAASSDASELCLNVGMSPRSVIFWGCERFLTTSKVCYNDFLTWAYSKFANQDNGVPNTTVHAFAHGLSSVLTFIRNRLAVWLYYAELEQMVTSLASMCSRGMDTTPDRFSELPIPPFELLSLIFETFETHIERHSPRDITAIMAYILTISSKPYIHALCRLLAYGEARQVHTVAIEKSQLMDLTSQFEGDEAESVWRESLANILPAAHKSLKLLEAAKPEHPIFSTVLPSKEISWTWTEENIKSQWNGVEVAFKIFDLEPGMFSSSEHDSGDFLDEFMVNFPSIFPHITPTPSLLCQLMFTPLRDHATSLSQALLAVFLDRSSFLCIDAHLELLRSHMLLTSQSFKSRLCAALFSDAEDRTSHSVQLYNLLRYKSKGTTLPDQSYTGRWPVGLAPLLVTRDSWPPGGSELSFLLRTVIVDSQQNNPQNAEINPSELDGAHRVMEEAEFRLGFAIRELSGRGQERWLDPLCSATSTSVDSHCGPFKVSKDLCTLAPLDASGVRDSFRFSLDTHHCAPSIPNADLLSRTTAPFPIRGALISQRTVHVYIQCCHWWQLRRFSVSASRLVGTTPDIPTGFRDVFALADCHSSVLDDILAACLLRSSQRAAGDLLRGTLEVVLEFCVLVGDLKDGRMQEYQASPALETLYISFRKKVTELMRALDVMLEKHGKSRGPEQLQAAYPEWESGVPPGGVDALRHLLTSLNQNDWWTKPH